MLQIQLKQGYCKNIFVQCKTAWARCYFYLIFAVGIAITGTSCTSPKELQYFQDLPNSDSINLPAVQPEERVIQINDRLLISFGAKDDQATAIFNKYGGVLTSGTDLISSGSQGGAELSGYLVDQDGYLEFPIIGKQKAEGLTSTQLKEALTRAVSLYLKNPLISVRFINFKVTVLGDVRTPGIYNLPMQKATILDALGASGDLTRSAKRYDVQLYRDYNGKRVMKRIDLRKKNILYNSDDFLLKNNDVIYVQPGKLNNENRGILTSLVSVAVGIVTLIVALRK